FTSILLNGFERERPALPALALTVDDTILSAASDNFSYENIFSKQLKAFAQPGDVLLAISSDANASNIRQSIKLAQARDMNVILLSGGEGDLLRAQLRMTDIEICAP